MFLSTNRLFFNFKVYFLLFSVTSNVISESPLVSKISDKISNSLKLLILIIKLLIGLFKISSKGIIFLTFTLIFLSVSFIFLKIVIITDLPSFIFSLFNSKISENINSSKTPLSQKI